MNLGLFSKKYKNVQEIEYEIEATKKDIDNQKVNHILHFLLSLFTAGIWLVVWFIIALSVSSTKSELNKKLKKLYEEKAKFENSEHSNIDVADKLSKLSEMLDKGHLTQAEFDTQKAKILKS